MILIPTKQGGRAAVTIEYFLQIRKLKLIKSCVAFKVKESIW